MKKLECFNPNLISGCSPNTRSRGHDVHRSPSTFIMAEQLSGKGCCPFVLASIRTLYRLGTSIRAPKSSRLFSANLSLSKFGVWIQTSTTIPVCGKVEHLFEKYASRLTFGSMRKIWTLTLATVYKLDQPTSRFLVTNSSTFYSALRYIDSTMVTYHDNSTGTPSSQPQPCSSAMSGATELAPCSLGTDYSNKAQRIVLGHDKPSTAAADVSQNGKTHRLPPRLTPPFPPQLWLNEFRGCRKQLLESIACIIIGEAGCDEANLGDRFQTVEEATARVSQIVHDFRLILDMA